MNSAGPSLPRGLARLAVLGVPDYRRLWVVGVTSSVVRWLDTLAFAVFAYQETGSALVVAMLTMLRMLPMGLVGGLLGALGERIERRTMLLAVLMLMCATSAVLAVLALAGILAVWHLAVASLLNGMAWASDNTVRRLMIGEVVGAGQLGAAMSIDIGSGNASRMLGPTLGGLLLAGIGIQGAFALGAALYLPPIIAAWRLTYRNPPIPSGPPALLARITEGLRVVRRDKRLTGVMTVTIIFNLFGWPFTSMVPVIGADRLKLGPGEIGILAGLDGFGALLAAAAMALWLRPGGYQGAYVGGTALYLLFVIGFALAPEPISAGAALMVSGVASSGFGIMQSTLVYLLAPPEMRSRVFGVLSMCIGMAPIGFIHLGVLADAIGAPLATAAIGAEGLLALLLTRKLWRVI